MGRPLVIGLAFGSVLLATFLCLVGIFRPSAIQDPIARFLLCLLVAFLFSVFVSVLFPNVNYKLNLGKFGIPIVLVGPAALWIALFLLLLYKLPSESVGGIDFAPAYGSERLQYNATWVLDWKPATPIYYKLQSDNINESTGGTLEGFYVRFDEKHDTYEAEIGVGPARQYITARYRVIFRRNASTYELERIPGQ
ncbi:MAG: hypothetical protein ABSG38_12765 [Spirochaetia bacterium]|jgi:hypothetical protein